MTTFRKINLLIAFGFAIILAGCAQQNATSDALAKDEHNTATAKPGASVQFSHQLRAPVSAGATGTIDFTIDENYDGGALWLQATGGDGLTVLSGETPVRFEMYSISQHKWSVTFSAQTDGIYYLNVLATVEPDGRSKSMRSYAVRIAVGNVSGLTSSKTNGVVSQSPDGEQVIILEAEETIDE